MHGSALPPSRVDMVRRLVADIMAGRDVVLLADKRESRAVLDDAGVSLAAERSRPIRIDAGVSGGVGLGGLLAQIGGQVAPERSDNQLERDFATLTITAPGVDRVVLLVSEAEALQDGALRYIQLACQASGALRLVFAGTPAVLERIDQPEFALLQSRLVYPPLFAAAAIIAMPGALTAALPLLATAAPALPIVPMPPAHPALVVAPSVAIPTVTLPMTGPQESTLAALRPDRVAPLPEAVALSAIVDAPLPVPSAGTAIMPVRAEDRPQLRLTPTRPALARSARHRLQRAAAFGALLVGAGAVMLAVTRPHSAATQPGTATVATVERPTSAPTVAARPLGEVAPTSPSVAPVSEPKSSLADLAPAHTPEGPPVVSAPALLAPTEHAAIAPAMSSGPEPSTTPVPTTQADTTPPTIEPSHTVAGLPAAEPTPSLAFGAPIVPALLPMPTQHAAITPAPSLSAAPLSAPLSAARAPGAPIPPPATATALPPPRSLAHQAAPGVPFQPRRPAHQASIRRDELVRLDPYRAQRQADARQWSDPYQRPEAPPQPVPFRPEYGYYGWNMPEGRAYIGTYTAGHAGARSFHYGN